MGLLALSKGPSNWTIPASKHPRMQRWRFGIERLSTTQDVSSLGYPGAFTRNLNITVNASALPGSFYYRGAARPVNSWGATILCASGVTQATANGCLEDTSLGANVPNPFNIGNLSSLQSGNSQLYSALSSVGSFFTSATISKATLLRPYPSSNLTVGMPLGHERETEFDLSVNHRFSRGLVANFAYTYFDSRFANSFLQAWNPFDSTNPQAPIWQPNNINPHRVTATWVYDLPFGNSRRWVHNKYAAFFAGGWTVAGNYVWSMGTLIGLPNTFYSGDLSSVKVANPAIGQWFNTAGCVLPGQTLGSGDVVVPLGQPCTAGWEKRTAMQLGAFQARIMPLYLDGLRNPNVGQLNGSLMRDFRFNVKDHPITLQVRGDMLNVANHSFLGGVNTGPTSGVRTFGAITSGSTVLNRFIQVQGHIRW